MSRAWTVALVGSGAGHVALAVVLSMMPQSESQRSGGSRRDRLFTPGAVVPIQTTAVTVMPTERPRFPTEPAAAPIDDPKSSQPSPDGSGQARGGTRPSTDPESQPTTPGMLSGARDKTSGATITGGSSGVVVDPSMLGGSRTAYEGSVGDPGVGNGGVQGPAEPAKSELAFTRQNGKLVYKDPGGRFVATLRSDGRVDFKNKNGKITWTDNAIGDPDALIRMAAGEDPYARAKAELLKATFDLRLGMAIAFQKKQIDKRLERLDGELDKIWTDERRDLAARKELIFQRWDECEEARESSEPAEVELPGFGAVKDSDLDQTRNEAGKDARERIVKFVRKHAPKGSAEQFTAAELADMNGRRVSKEKFSPY